MARSSVPSEIADATMRLDTRQVVDLTELLARV